MNTAQTAQQLELTAQILRTSHPFEFSEDHFHWFKAGNDPLYHIKRENEIRLVLAVPLDNRPLHNPDNLTAEQVGAGWRLAVAGDKLDTSCQYWGEGKSWKPCRTCSHLGSCETYRLPLSVPWPEVEKPDPYAELKAAHAAGKVIQTKFSTIRNWVDRIPDWTLPPDQYRIKPEPALQLPPSPPGMQWHREDGWREGDLPQGWRPLVFKEKQQVGDEFCVDGRWKKIPAIASGEESLTSYNRRRTTRPLTFTHEGKQWTWHRPGDPMPCDGERKVVIVMRDLEIGGALKARHYEWSVITDSQDAEIIGWRYADKKKTVPLGPDDVPPGSVLSLKPPRWFIISGVNDNGLYVLDDEPLVENLWKWDYLMEKAKINRSIPLTGKWNPSAWEPCHKIQTENP